MTLASHGPRWRIIFLLGIGALIACGEGRARADDSADKRRFAEALKRREQVAKGADHAVRASVASAPRVALAHAEKHSRLFSTGAAPAQTGPAGIPPASPLIPTGYGVGRDGFAATFFLETFGAPITEQQLHSLSAALARGVKPEKIAENLWRSPEHRALQQAGLAPNLTYQQAYNRAIASGTFARRWNFPGPGPYE